MKSLDLFRKTVDARRSQIEARINKRKFTSMDSTNLSSSEIENLPVQLSTPIQNPNGTFVNMPGYDY